MTTDEGTNWNHVPGWYLGGGVSVDLGPTFLGFELGTNVLNPEDVRFGINWGVKLGKRGPRG